jgi:hypothetical protein
MTEKWMFLFKLHTFCLFTYLFSTLSLYSLIFVFVYLFIAFEEQCKQIHKICYEKVSRRKHTEVLLSDSITYHVLRILLSALFIVSGVPDIHDIVLVVTYTTDNAPTWYSHGESTVVTKLQTIMFRYQIESIWIMLERYPSVVIRYNVWFCCADNEPLHSTTIKKQNNFPAESKFQHVPVRGTSNQ